MEKVKSPILDFIKSTKGKEGMTLDDSRLYSEHIDTGIYVLNGMLSGDFYGGLETGRSTELIGESASGKSAIAMYLMVKFLEKYIDNGICYLYETEGRVSESLVTMIPQHLINRVIVIPVSTVDEFNEQLLGNLKTNLEEYKEKGHDIRVMVVLDSLGNLGTTKESEDSAKGKNSTTDMKRAQQIKKLFRTIAIPLLSKFQVPFVAINHIYDVIGAYVPTTKASGGKGAEYLSNNIIEVRKVNDDESKSEKKKSAFKLKIVKSMVLVPKTINTVYFVNGKFSKYSNILTLAKELKIVSDRSAGAKGKIYIFKDKEYTKKDLANNESVMEEIVKLTNEAWKKENSFLINTEELNNIEEESDENDNEENLNSEE